MEVQADLGLAVIGLGVERVVTDHVAVQVEAFITSTYFLDWFDLNARADGFGGGVRLTYLAHPGRSGVYGAALLRLSGASIGDSDTFLMTEWGAAVGYSIALPHDLDLRLGLGIVGFHGGATEIKTGSAERVSVDAPFLQGDIVLGYRL